MQARPPNPGPDDGDRRAKALRSPEWGRIFTWAAVALALALAFLTAISVAGCFLDRVQL